MKRIYYILLSLVIIGFNSCNDMLDMRPISEQTTGNFYQTQAHMESAVAAMYNGLRDYHTQDKFRLAMCPSDNIEVGGAGYDEGPGGITKYITLSSNFVVLDYWQEAYSSIHRCNVVMERADGVEYDDTDLKTQHIAEARFIRGLIYYDLVRFFAGVPLITESRALEEYYQIPRSSEEEIWNFAQLELEYAAANLPAEINGSGRANKFAALGILADLHLNRNQNYSAAKAAIDQVIPNYELFADFADVWDDGNNNGAHSIFAVQFLGQTGEGNPLPTAIVPKFIWEGMWLYAGQGGENNLQPSQEFWDSWDPNDVRRDLSMSNWYFDGRDPIDPDLGHPADTIYENWVLKYGINNTPYAFREWGINHIVMRTAEALLIKAECENELENPAEAVTLINQIRTRAELSDFSSNDKQAIREEIFAQRRFELCFENERWFDLQRWDALEPGKMDAILNAFVNYRGASSYNWEAKYRLYPIPITEIVKVPEGVLTQNPGF